MEDFSSSREATCDPSLESEIEKRPAGEESVALPAFQPPPMLISYGMFGTPSFSLSNSAAAHQPHSKSARKRRRQPEKMGSAAPDSDQSGAQSSEEETIADEVLDDHESDTSESTFGSSRLVIDSTSARLSTASKDTIASEFPVYAKSEAVRSVINTALRNIFIFEALDPAELDGLINIFRPISSNVGDDVITQGDQAEFM